MAKGMRWYGKSTKGVKAYTVRRVAAAAASQGAVGIYVISGHRTPETNTGVQNSNHLTGNAIDGYAIMADGSHVPLGTLLKGVAGQYGLRSGDQAGFYKGSPDPNHVDTGANVNGGRPLTPTTSVPTTQDTTPDTSTGATQRYDGTTQTTSSDGEDVSGQLDSALNSIPQLPGAPLASAPLAGYGGPDTSLQPQTAGSTWQLIAAQGNVSPDTIRLARLASYGSDGSSTAG